MIQQPPQQVRQKVPLEGPGPHGVPETYYTSRALDSTFRYVKFVRKLRAEEADQRKGAENQLKELQDKQYSDFFIHCDRRSLINNVARRVDLCLASYEADLQKKREKLKQLLVREEEENMHKYVAQAQAATDTIWQQRQARLAFLLAKRKKEHEDKYKDTPLSKCAHVLQCIEKLRAKEAQQIQLCQMKEKAARRAAEKEIDNMWYEVAMKESEALAARMEYDVIEQCRHNMDCFQNSMREMEQNRINKEKEKASLKLESLYFRGLWDQAIKDEEEAERLRREERHKVGQERQKAIQEKVELTARLAEEDKRVQHTWSTLTNQFLDDIKGAGELRKRKEREQVECNRKLIQLRDEMSAGESHIDDLVHEEAKRQQDITDQKRCQYLGWAQKTNREVRKAVIDQIHDRKEAREALQKRLLEQDEYQRQLFGQLTQLAKHKDLTDWQARKKHQDDLLQQIEYNKLLKERALQEEREERRKCQQATSDYKEDIKLMLCRPYFSDEIHPFMRQMAKADGLKMQPKCPCSKPDYCGAPAPNTPKPNS